MNNYGTEYNLSKSPYIYETFIDKKHVKFFFSTENRKKRFIAKEKISTFKLNNELSSKLGIKADVQNLILFKNYIDIEKVGYRIEINGINTPLYNIKCVVKLDDEKN